MVQSASPLCSLLYLSALQPALSTLKVQIYVVQFSRHQLFISKSTPHIPALVGCVGKLVDVAMDCQTCIKGLVCCVTDSCR